MSWGGLQVDGNKVTWEKWHIRTSFNYREGLVLHDVGCATLGINPLKAQGCFRGLQGDFSPSRANAAHLKGSVLLLTWETADSSCSLKLMGT